MSVTGTDPSAVSSSPAPGRLDRFYQHLEHRSVWAIVAFSAIYLNAVLDVVRVRRLWEDELFTYALARLRSGELWRALLTGADQHPFPFYRFAGALLGVAPTKEVALRMPAVFSGWVLALALFYYVARRTSPVYGLVAMFAVMATRAWSYACEARGYEALVAGLAVAFLGWAESERTRWGVVLLALGLLMAASNHYYALFGVVPLAAGEIVRTWQRRRLAWAIWGAFATTLVPLFFSLPLIAASRPYGANFWGKPNPVAIPATYDFLLGTAVFPTSVLLVAATAYVFSARMRSSPTATIDGTAAELLCLGGFAILPIITAVGASVTTGAYTPRYAIATVIGVTTLGTLLLSRAFQGRLRPGLACAILLAGWCEWQSLRDVSQSWVDRERQDATARWIADLNKEQLPVVVWQAGTFLEMAQYGPTAVTDRLVYIADAAAALHYLGHDTSGRSLQALRPWFPPTIDSYEGYFSRITRFLLFGDSADNVWRNWLLSRLLDDGARLTVVGRRGDSIVFLVDMVAH